MIRALDSFFGRIRPAPRPTGADRMRTRRAETTSLREANRFEKDNIVQVWSAPSHWRL